MKFFLTFLCLISASLSITASDILDVHRFGAEGDLTPRIMGQSLPETFFNTHHSRSLSHERNYVAYMAVPKTSYQAKMDKGLDFDATPQARYMELNVSNQTDLDIDVVLYATRGNKAMNFLLRVPAADILRLDVSSLARFEDLHLISLFSFEAQLQHELPAGMVIKSFAHRNAEVDAIESATAKLGTGCYEITHYRRLYGPGWHVFAYFSKHLNPNAAPGSDDYFMSVYYPTAGMLFHRGYAAYNPNSNCEAEVYSTVSEGTYIVNYWFNMDASSYNNGYACKDTTWETSGCTSTTAEYYVGPIF